MAKNTKKPAAKPKTAGKKKTVIPKRSSSAKPAKQSGAGKSTKKPGKVAGKKSPEKEEFPHFRRYKKSNHPALITGEHSEKEYKYRKVMHSDREGGRPNEVVYPNPDPTDPDPMYIGKRVRHDKKNSFGEKYPWKYPKKDKEKK